MDVIPPEKRRNNGVTLLLFGTVFLAFGIGIVVVSRTDPANVEGSPVLGTLVCVLIAAFLYWTAVQAFRGKTDLRRAPRPGQPQTFEERQQQLDAMDTEGREAFERIQRTLATPTSASSPTTARLVLAPKFCAGCGASLEAVQGFCPQCGKPVEPYEEVRVLTSNDAASPAERAIGGVVAAARDVSDALSGGGPAK